MSGPPQLFNPLMGLSEGMLYEGNRGSKAGELYRYHPSWGTGGRATVGALRTNSCSETWMGSAGGPSNQEPNPEMQVGQDIQRLDLRPGVMSLRGEASTSLLSSSSPSPRDITKAGNSSYSLEHDADVEFVNRRKVQSNTEMYERQIAKRAEVQEELAMKREEQMAQELAQEEQSVMPPELPHWKGHQKEALSAEEKQSLLSRLHDGNDAPSSSFRRKTDQEIAAIKQAREEEELANLLGGRWAGQQGALNSARRRDLVNRLHQQPAHKAATVQQQQQKQQKKKGQKQQPRRTKSAAASSDSERDRAAQINEEAQAAADRLLRKLAQPTARPHARDFAYGSFKPQLNPDKGVAARFLQPNSPAQVRVRVQLIGHARKTM